jgi:hypothetical protein
MLVPTPEEAIGQIAMREVTQREYHSFTSRKKHVTIENSDLKIGHPWHIVSFNPPKDYKPEEFTVWSFPSRGDWATNTGSYRGNWSRASLAISSSSTQTRRQGPRSTWGEAEQPPAKSIYFTQGQSHVLEELVESQSITFGSNFSTRLLRTQKGLQSLIRMPR